MNFDFVLNTYSFQEMTLSEINRYFNFIRQHLESAGIFYFLNNFGAAGAQKPSDYPFNLFNILSFKPSAVPAAGLNHRKRHIEVILSCKTGLAEWPTSFEKLSYVVSLLMYMGLDGDLAEFCGCLTKGNISADDYAYFTELEKIICGRKICNMCAQAASLNKFSQWSHITAYISGLLNLFDHNYTIASNLFEKAVNSGLSGFAYTKACIAQWLIYNKLGRRAEAEKFYDMAVKSSVQFECEIKERACEMDLTWFIRSYKFAFPNMRINQLFILQKIVNIIKKYLRHIKAFK